MALHAELKLSKRDDRSKHRPTNQVLSASHSDLGQEVYAAMSFLPSSAFEMVSKHSWQAPLTDINGLRMRNFSKPQPRMYCLYTMHIRTIHIARMWIEQWHHIRSRDFISTTIRNALLGSSTLPHNKSSCTEMIHKRASESMEEAHTTRKNLDATEHFAHRTGDPRAAQLPS